MPKAGIRALAVSARCSMYDPSAVFYMEKLATGPGGAFLTCWQRLCARPHQPQGHDPDKPQDTSAAAKLRPETIKIITGWPMRSSPTPELQQWIEAKTERPRK